ncbi:MAG: hypothetical protein ACYC5G_02630 [Candidatus Doudnabacteria bacterium]
MQKKYISPTLVLTFLGLCFAGYLSLTKLITNVCALNEACPYFIGYPACWYGFAMFAIMFITALLVYLNKVQLSKARYIIGVVSLIGIIFAGSFIVPEMRPLLAGQASYSLGLPSCAYGFIFYVIIFGLTLRTPNETKEIL